MFGAASPAKLGPVIALLIVALHAAAWPIAGWLVEIEDGPHAVLDGVVKLLNVEPDAGKVDFSGTQDLLAQMK